MAGGSRWPATYASPVPYGPVDAALDLPALEERLLARWRADDLFGQVQGVAGRCAAVDLLRGAADRQRPPRAPPRVGAGLQGPLPAVPDDAGSRRPPAGRLGQPRPAGGDRGREGAGAAARSRTSRRTAWPRSTSGAGSRCRATSQDWIALTDRSGIWFDTEHAYWTMSNDFIESVWWLVRQLWDAGLLYEGHRVTPVLPPLRHRAVVARARPAGRLPGRGRPVGLRALPRHRSRRRPPGVDHDAVDARLQRGRRRRSRHPLRAHRRARRRPRTSCWPRRPRTGDGRERRCPRPGQGRTWWAGATADRSICCPSTTAARGSWPPTSSRPTKARVSSTWLRRSARPTRSIGRQEELPVVNPVGTGRHVRRSGHPVGRALREGRRSRDHRRPPQPGAAGGGGAVRAQLPPLLAVRDAPAVLGQDVVVRAHVGPPGRPPAGERAHRLAPRAHQARPLRQVAGGQRGLGPLAGPVLGHAAAGLALP